MIEAIKLKKLGKNYFRVSTNSGEDLLEFTGEIHPRHFDRLVESEHFIPSLNELRVVLTQSITSLTLGGFNIGCTGIVLDRSFTIADSSDRVYLTVTSLESFKILKNCNISFDNESSVNLITSLLTFE